jgi:hypothetical protein
MKKRYIQPSTNEFVLSTFYTLLTASNEITVHDEVYNDEEMTDLSRSFSGSNIWDEEKNNE